MDHNRTTTGMADLGRIQHGWDVYAADGEKVGDVAEVHGSYLIVSKGWLFPTERYIPAAAISQVEPERVTLRVMKDQLDAQNWDRVPDDIDPSHQERTSGRAAMGTSAGTVEEDRDTLRLREEQLRARKETVEGGEVEIRKEVVAEQRTIDVPITREEVVIERRPVDRAEAERFDAGDIGEGETLRVPVREEQVTVEKTPVVTEEFSVGKRVRQDTERVEGTVRREEVSIEHDDDVEVLHRQSDIPHAGERTPRRSD